MIGIFGGTFNPIHNGHIKLAEQVSESLALDEVHFLPCANPVHRGAPQVSSGDRLNMIKLAIATKDRFVANTLELDRGGASFMVDTLREVRELNRDESIVLMLGADAFNAIRYWKQSAELLDLAHLIVCQRPDIEMDHDIFSDRRVQSVESLRQENYGHVLPLTINQSHCSSTRIREQLMKQESTSSCLPAAVLEYIVNNHLYEN
jgi:nicotinate-nucleotide adenylyltransferase